MNIKMFLLFVICLTTCITLLLSIAVDNPALRDNKHFIDFKEYHSFREMKDRSIRHEELINHYRLLEIDNNTHKRNYIKLYNAMQKLGCISPANTVLPIVKRTIENHEQYDRLLTKNNHKYT